MEGYIRNIDIRWSDLDPNAHIRHSVYYDWGAFCRVAFLNENGLDATTMQAQEFGPILFREEAQFRKEIRSGDSITIDLTLLRARRDFSRWTIRHHLRKGDHVLCAVITVDGAWINTRERKLTAPAPIAVEVFSKMPRDEKFEWIER